MLFWFIIQISKLSVSTETNFDFLMSIWTETIFRIQCELIKLAFIALKLHFYNKLCTEKSPNYRILIAAILNLHVLKALTLLILQFT